MSRRDATILYCLANTYQPRCCGMEFLKYWRELDGNFIFFEKYAKIEKMGRNLGGSMDQMRSGCAEISFLRLILVDIYELCLRVLLKFKNIQLSFGIIHILNQFSDCIP